MIELRRIMRDYVDCRLKRVVDYTGAAVLLLSQLLSDCLLVDDRVR